MINGKTKEKFCGLCAAIPLAFASGGSTVVSGKKRKDNENSNYNMIYDISMILTILSVLYIIYYLISPDCKKCKI